VRPADNQFTASRLTVLNTPLNVRLLQPGIDHGTRFPDMPGQVLHHGFDAWARHAFGQSFEGFVEDGIRWETGFGEIDSRF
jgi:hypothetical protein